MPHTRLLGVDLRCFTISLFDLVKVSKVCLQVDFIPIISTGPGSWSASINAQKWNELMKRRIQSGSSGLPLGFLFVQRKKGGSFCSGGLEGLEEGLGGDSARGTHEETCQVGEELEACG